MAESTRGSAREEAERLVATALAAARMAAAGLGTGPTAPVAVSGLISDLLGRLGTPAERAGTPGETGADPAADGAAHPGPAGDPTGSDRVHGTTGPETVPGPAGHRFATGSAECCVCPICRAMAALRDPSPEFAEQLATGAGDLAAGVASLLRAFSAVGATAPRRAGPDRGPASGPDRHPPAGPGRDPAAGSDARPGSGPGGDSGGARAGTGVGDSGDRVWRAATRTGHDDQPEPARDVWAAATTAASRSDATGVTSPVEPAGGSPTVPAARAPETLVRTDEGTPGDEA